MPDEEPTPEEVRVAAIIDEHDTKIRTLLSENGAPHNCLFDNGSEKLIRLLIGKTLSTGERNELSNYLKFQQAARLLREARDAAIADSYAVVETVVWPDTTVPGPTVPPDIFSSGTPGAQGLPGLDGSVGPQGIPGADGAAGAAGAAGPSGADGAQGLQGDPGAQGPIGPQGVPGPSVETDPVATAALNTHAALTTTAHGGLVSSADSRLSDARTPTAHTHVKASITDFAHTHPPSEITGTAVVTADSRLSDARTPTAHTHVKAAITDFAHTHAPSEVTGTAVVTADARLSDARTPLAHTHAPSEITGTAVVTADARLSDARTPVAHTHLKSEVGLPNVDDTADSSKPVSTAQAAAIALKQDLRAVQTSAPATGQTTTFNILGKNEQVALTHSATIAAHTLVFPANANSQIGQELAVFSRSIITAVTLTLNSNTIYGTALTTLPASGNARWRKTAASIWVRVQ